MLKFPPLHLFDRAKWSGEPSPDHFSLIDLGTDTIKVAVIEKKETEIRVLGHSLATAQGRDVVGGRAEAAALAATVNGALKEAEDATAELAGRKIIPDNALFVLPGRSVAGKLFTVKQARSKPLQPITVRETDQLWERATRLARQSLPALPGVGRDWIPQAVTPAGLWLDGRLVNDPVGLHGELLFFSVYGVICRPAILRALTQLSERLELDTYQMVAASQSLATIVPARAALVFDIGASGTDCYLIRHDALIGVGRTFMGGRFFTRGLSRALGQSFERAETLKLAYASQNVLSAQETETVAGGLAASLRRWADMAAETIFGLNGRVPLPGRIFFVGGSATLPGLDIALRGRLEHLDLSFDRAPEVARLGETPLPGFSYAPQGFRGILFALVLSLAKTL